MSESKMVKIQAARALYRDGSLIFADPALAPKGVTEVVVTYVEEFPIQALGQADVIQALRGRGKGEQLVARLLQARREDQERNERSRRHLPA